MRESNDPIAALLIRTANKDMAAFQQLFEITAARQLAIATRLLRQPDMAEEAVQDAYLSIWDKAANFKREAGSAQGWITTIVRRRAIDRLRASPWLTREVGADWLDEAPAIADMSDDRRALEQCLDQLSAKVNCSIRLAYLFGLTHAELSRLLDLPLGTLKSRLRRGLAALKECLTA